MTFCDRCHKEITNEAEHGLYLCPLEPTPAGFGVAGDDIPGGFIVKHGVGLQGRKFYSKTELKRAANEHGWTIGGDTPKPYRVSWSGRQKTQAGRPVTDQ